MPTKIRTTEEELIGEDETSEEERGMFENLKYTVKLCFSKNIIALYPLYIWSGFSIVIFNGMLIPIMVL